MTNERGTEARIFKWVCLAFAVTAAGVLGWMIDDMRREVKRTNATVNLHLPQVLENVRQGTVTLANVSKDIEALRDLLGIANEASDRSLIQYADSVLDFLEAQPTGQIALTKLVGSGLKDVVPVQDWVRDARKEALWLTFRASSKAELLERLAKTKFGADWHFVAPGIEPIKLLDFLRLNHAGSKAP